MEVAIGEGTFHTNRRAWIWISSMHIKTECGGNAHSSSSMVPRQEDPQTLLDTQPSKFVSPTFSKKELISRVRGDLAPCGCAPVHMHKLDLCSYGSKQRAVLLESTTSSSPTYVVDK